jgi:spermidine synthase
LTTATAPALDAQRDRPAQPFSTASLWIISICFIFSGATGLIYEVLWMRMLGLVFGATTFAVSTVLAAFMGGLALGSAAAGRMGAKIRRPLRVYGLMEIAIALYALAVPFLFELIDHLYALIWTEFRPGFYAFSIWRFLLSCAALLLPTALMGATLPVLSAALLQERSRNSSIANRVARLYTCNLLGAILGTLAAGFILLPLVGLRATIWTAALINIIIGIVSILADRGQGKTAIVEENIERALGREGLEEARAASSEGREPEETNRAAALTGGREELAGKRFWFLAAAVSGFVTISTQVAWTRVLTMIIGSSTYAFSLVVALFLLGLALGAYIIGRTRLAAHLRRWLMGVEILTGLTIIMSVWVINRAPGILFYQGTRLGINSWTGLLALQGAVASLIVLLPALLMGMVMPLVLVWAEGERTVSVRLVGRSYAVNTLGAITGAFLTGFLFIPKIGTRFTILFAAWLCLILAGLAYKPLRASVDTALMWRVLVVAAMVVLPLFMFRFVPRLNSADLSIGVYDRLARGLAHSQGSAAGGGGKVFSPLTNRVLMYEEGPTATVTVREDWGVTSMAINGRTNASDNFAADGDMATQVMVGQLPLLIAPRTETALIVGYASGVSVGSMLQSELRSLECVELEPVTVKAAERFFEHVNNSPTKDPRLRLIIDDARTYLRVVPTEYDIIVSEPSHPWVPGVANLFTQEFFELGRARLKSDGVFVQWVQIYQLSTDSLRSVLATYMSVFPHVMMFRVGGAGVGKDLILVGSRQPLSFERVEERMRNARIRAELERINVRELRDIESWYVCNEAELGPAVDGAPINTDDNMRIENRAPREAFLPLMEANSAWIEKLAAEARSRRP